MDLDPEVALKLLGELQELNKNMRESKQATQNLVNRIKDIGMNAKAIYNLSKQISLLNQIMLQVGKASGYSGIIQHLLDSLVRLGRKTS